MLTIAVGIIAGLAPARFGRRGNLVAALQADQPSAPRRLPGRVLRSMLVGGQAAASIVLLVLAALLTRTVVETGRVDVGYDPGRLLNVSVTLSASTSGQSPARADAFWRAALERVRQIPGVADAARVNFAPFGGRFAPQQINGRAIDRNETSPGYFETRGVRLIQGRMYTDEEMRSEAPVAVISASLAREFFGMENPVGSSLERVSGPWRRAAAGHPEAASRRPRHRRGRRLGRSAEPPERADHLYAAHRTLGSETGRPHTCRSAAAGRAVQGALLAIDPSARATSTPVIDTLRRNIEGPRASPSRHPGRRYRRRPRRHRPLRRDRLRRRTTGARDDGAATLGASDSQLLTLLFRESLRPVVVGLVLGLGISLLSGRVVQSVLYGVSSRNPLAIVSAVAILLLAAAAAVVLPARRATQVSAAQLLKQG